MIIELNKLRVDAVTLTAILLSIKYNTKIKVSEEFNTSKIYTYNKNVAIGIYLLYYQMSVLRNIEPTDNIKDIFKKIPFFISFKDNLINKIWIELENIIGNKVEGIKQIYTDYNIDLANILYEAKNSNNGENYYKKFINLFLVFSQKVLILDDAIEEFILKVEPIEPIKELHKKTLATHKYIENDALTVEIDSIIKYNLNDIINIENNLNDFFFKAVYIYFNKNLTEKTVYLNSYLTIVKNEKFNKLITADMQKKYNFEKEEFVYEQLEEFKQKIETLNLKNILKDYSKINSVDDLYRITNKIIRKYIKYIPTTEDKYLKKIRNIELAKITNELKNSILKTLDIITKTNEKERNEKIISSKSTPNKSVSSGTDTDRRAEQKKDSWNSYTEGQYWNT